MRPLERKRQLAQQMDWRGYAIYPLARFFSFSIDSRDIVPGASSVSVAFFDVTIAYGHAPLPHPVEQARGTQLTRVASLRNRPPSGPVNLNVVSDGAALAGHHGPMNMRLSFHTHKSEAHINWSTVTCQGSTRLELP